MSKAIVLLRKARLWKDNKGQDLIEYALMASFLAVAAVTLMPGLVTSISVYFTKITVALSAVGGAQ